MKRAVVYHQAERCVTVSSELASYSPDRNRIVFTPGWSGYASMSHIAFPRWFDAVHARIQDEEVHRFTVEVAAAAVFSVALFALLPRRPRRP